MSEAAAMARPVALGCCRGPGGGAVLPILIEGEVGGILNVVGWVGEGVGDGES